jgi:hypothetical protein
MGNLPTDATGAAFAMQSQWQTYDLGVYQLPLAPSL